MVETDMELEEQLASVGERLRTPPSDENELLVVLEETESLLLKVEQSPSTSMFTSLRPVMDALVAKEFLSHSNVDVKVSVASCISEITRITAPDAPYDDELMKVIFELIVEAFKGLDDVSSPSFSKRVSILETVAKVRSCVVMLDLECDRLILDMFHHFFTIIRDSHSESVFSLMETIMTLVLEESEEISSELLSCLLLSVKNDNNDILPIARTLGERVIGNCSAKLKPNLLELFQSTSTSLTDYSRAVASVCQDKPDLHENNNYNSSGEHLEDDGKLSERTISEEMQQEHGRKGLEAGCSEVVNTTSSKPSKSPMSNGTVHAATVDSVDNDKEAVEAPSKGRKRTKGDIHSPAVEKTGPSSLSDDEKANSIGLPKVADDVRPRRGRPPGSKTSAKKAANSTTHHSATPKLKKISIKQQHVEEAEPSKDIAIEKQVEMTSDSVEKTLRHLRKEGPVEINQEGKTMAKVRSKKEDATRSDSEGRSSRFVHRKKEKSSDNEPSKKSQMHRGRSRKESNTSENDAEDQTLKEMASRPKARIRSSKEEDKSKENLNTPSTKKRGRGKVISKSPVNIEDLDEKLVGSSIQVWWPEDKMFYPGVIDSYNPSTKKHKVLYADGDIEVLRLKNEKWEFVNVDNLIDKGGDAQVLDSPDLPLKKVKADPDSTTKHTEVDAPLKSNVSSGKPKGNTSRSRGKSVGSKRKLSERSGYPSREDSGQKSDSETAEIADKTSKSSKVKVGKSSSRNDSQSDRRNSGTKPKVGTTKGGDKFTDSAPKSKGIAEKSSNKSKKQDSPSIEKASERSSKAGRKVKGTSTNKSNGKSAENGNSTKAMSKTEAAKDSDSKTKSNSGKTSDGSRIRRLTIRS